MNVARLLTPGGYPRLYGVRAEQFSRKNYYVREHRIM